MSKISPPLKWHGGKHYLAERVIELMGEHVHYVEPFFGGGSVLLQKNPVGVSEVVNDLNDRLVNFWRVLQQPDLFGGFSRRVQAVPFSQELWEDSRAGLDGALSVDQPSVDRAVSFFVCCRQSRAGKFDCFATLSKNRTRRGMNEQASAWLSAVEGLPAVANRLQRVVVLNDDAAAVIRREDSPNTLFYLDPPYLHSTRVTTRDYAFEMSDEQHAGLLELLQAVRGKVILSGYRSEIYDDCLADWRRVDIEIDNKASSAKTKPKKTECLWLNYS